MLIRDNLEAFVLNNTALKDLKRTIHGGMLISINTICSDECGVIVRLD
jgi:hypothetical protein